jgi:hypothetical protein
MAAALSREHIARGPAWERPGARPAVSCAVGGATPWITEFQEEASL